MEEYKLDINPPTILSWAAFLLESGSAQFIKKVFDSLYYLYTISLTVVRE